MKQKFLELSRFSFYFPFVWGSLLVLGFTAPQWWCPEWRSLPFIGQTTYPLLLLALAAGIGMIALGSYLRGLAEANDELINEVKLQNDRIWRLEDAIAELKGARPRAD